MQQAGRRRPPVRLPCLRTARPRVLKYLPPGNGPRRSSRRRTSRMLRHRSPSRADWRSRRAAGMPDRDLPNRPCREGFQSGSPLEPRPEGSRHVFRVDQARRAKSDTPLRARVRPGREPCAARQQRPYAFWYGLSVGSQHEDGRSRCDELKRLAGSRSRLYSRTPGSACPYPGGGSRSPSSAATRVGSLTPGRRAGRRGTQAMKHVHGGRVNSARLMGYMASIGCHSVDGTGASKWRPKRLPQYLDWAARSPQLRLTS
jgi:hypothetical protein